MSDVAYGPLVELSDQFPEEDDKIFYELYKFYTYSKPFLKSHDIFQL